MIRLSGRVPTGVDGLDTLIEGGFMRGDVILVAGRKILLEFDPESHYEKAIQDFTRKNISYEWGELDDAKKRGRL